LLAFNKDNFGRGARTKLSKQINPEAAMLNRSCNRTFFVTKTNTKPAKKTNNASHRAALNELRIVISGEGEQGLQLFRKFDRGNPTPAASDRSFNLLGDLPQ
jgi:hypothetical protein